MSDWNESVKRLLKAELVKRGISHNELAILLSTIGVEETRSSIDSKISRGTFSATFLLQCLIAIGCDRMEIEMFEKPDLMAAEPLLPYPQKTERNA